MDQPMKLPFKSLKVRAQGIKSKPVKRSLAKVIREMYLILTQHIKM